MNAIVMENGLTEKIRLLIVDDDPAQLRVLCDLLRAQGYETQGLGSAQRALEALRPGEFDSLSRALEVQRLRRENAELQERERRQSEELAAAHRDLASFCHSVSHDLRAPLRSVDSFARILEEDFADGLGDEARRVIGIIRSGSRKMDQMIVGLLEFSRAGRERLDVDRIDMTALAGAAAAEVAANYMGTEPRIDIADLPAVDGDPAALRQVWCNLIDNALKYSAKRSEPRIRICGRIDGREAIYQVEDNGAGFDMRYADTLFGVFQRLHRPEDFSGAGVGLAIVHRIMVRHGGRVWARSAPDQGACFQFALPLGAAS